MRDRNELETWTGDFGWIASADALVPEIASLRDVTAALRSGAREPREPVPAFADPSRADAPALS